jgi:hypothetical protein
VDKAFFDFVRLVVSGRLDEVSRQVTGTPALATTASEVGASRQAGQRSSIWIPGHCNISSLEVDVTHTFHPVHQRRRQHTSCRGIIALALSVIFVPCALAQQVTTEFDETVDFTRFKTFAIRDGQLRSPSPALNSELTKKRVEAEIERALTARGLTKATGSSDLNVFYTLGSLRRVETEAYPAGWRGLGTRVARVPNTEGNLVIDLRDPTTRSLVWRGVATEEKPNPAKLAEKLGDMVKKAIARYPPKK